MGFLKEKMAKFEEGHSIRNTGRTHFKKGNIPWNKGLKGYDSGTFEVGHKQSNTGRTHFIKGQKPWNFGKDNLPNCLDCNKKLSNYDSKRCKKHMGGQNHYLWKGTTPLNKWIRNRVEYQQWRTKIFQRDNYTCQLCFKKGGRLEVDHYPKTFSQLLEENNINSLADALNCEALWNVEKNRTLCEICHKATPTWGHKTLFLRREKFFYG